MCALFSSFARKSALDPLWVLNLFSILCPCFGTVRSHRSHRQERRFASPDHLSSQSRATGVLNCIPEVSRLCVCVCVYAALHDGNTFSPNFPPRNSSRWRSQGHAVCQSFSSRHTVVSTRLSIPPFPLYTAGR